MAEKKPKTAAPNEVTIDADKLGRAVDDLLQKDRLDSDQSHAGNKPGGAGRPEGTKGGEVDRDHRP